jgi:hypothetical protein
MAALNPYLASQLSGPYAQALINAVQQEVVLASGEINYLYKLSVKTSTSGFNNIAPNYPLLSTIGQLVGYFWPVVPYTLLSTSGVFTFCTCGQTTGSGTFNPVFNAYLGFGSVISGGTLSGVLTSVYANTYITASSYQQLLPLAAQIKRTGLTLSGIDSVCQVFGPHTIAFAGAPNYGDVKVTFNPDISALSLYVANALFVTFATEPQVLLYNA